MTNWQELRDRDPEVTWKIRFSRLKRIIGFEWYKLQCYLNPWRRWDWIRRPTLNVTYMDIDVRMEHVVLGFLDEYVDNELGGRDGLLAHIHDLMKDLASDHPPEWDVEGSLARYENVLALYDWWQVRKKFISSDDAAGECPSRKEHDEATYSRLCAEYFEKCEAQQALDTEKMIQVIRLRGMMWT